MKKKMRAAYYEDFGGPEAVQLGEIEIPELKGQMC